MDISDPFGAIWRHRWWILVAALLIGLLAAGLSSLRPERYETSALVGVGAVAVGENPDSVVFLARTYAARAETRPVLERVVQESGLDLTVDQVQQRTSASVSEDTGMITLTARAGEATEAQQLASTTARALITHLVESEGEGMEGAAQPLDERLAELEDRLAELDDPDSAQAAALDRQYQSLLSARTQLELRPAARLEVLSPPALPQEPVSPQPLRNGLLALVVAGVLAAEAAIAREALQRRRARDASEPGAAPPSGTHAPDVDVTAP